jgi:hypothetical protein
VVWSPRQGQWLSHPRPDSKMQRKRTGPGGARGAPGRGLGEFRSKSRHLALENKDRCNQSTSAHCAIVVPSGRYRKQERPASICIVRENYRKYYNFFDIPNGTEGLLLHSSHALENTIQYLRGGFAVRSFGVNRA